MDVHKNDIYRCEANSIANGQTQGLYKAGTRHISSETKLAQWLLIYFSYIGEWFLMSFISRDVSLKIRKSLQFYASKYPEIFLTDLLWHCCHILEHSMRSAAELLCRREWVLLMKTKYIVRDVQHRGNSWNRSLWSTTRTTFTRLIRCLTTVQVIKVARPRCNAIYGCCAGQWIASWKRP